MDYVTRQFINLTKKFRKDLRKYVSNLDRALHKQTETIRESYQATERKQSSPPEVTVLNHLPESIEVHQNAKDTSDERNYRRAAFFVTALTLGAIVVYADLVNLQYREMIKATNAAETTADAAQKQFEASERPWIKITDLKTTGKGQLIPALSFIGYGHPPFPNGRPQAVWFQTRVEIRNIGHSVAHTTIESELFLPQWGDKYAEVLAAEQKRFCDTSAKSDQIKTTYRLVFPDDPLEWAGAASRSITADVVNRVSPTGEASSSGFILPIIIVCANYQLGTLPKVYQTRALFDVLHLDGKRSFEIPVQVPDNQIRIQREELLDDAY
jgi:hypothetical protein